MIKFVILDVYPNKRHRLIKDTAGGYGTGNDFGIHFFKIIKCLCWHKYWNAGWWNNDYKLYLKKHKVHYTRDFMTKRLKLWFCNMNHQLLWNRNRCITKFKHKKIFVTGIFKQLKRKIFNENQLLWKIIWYFFLQSCKSNDLN